MDSQIFDPKKLVDLLWATAGMNENAVVSAQAIVTAVYLCSLYREEAREVRFRLLAVEGLADEDDGSFDLLRLAEPIEITVSSLRRLAFATKVPDDFFVVDVSGNQPRIVGLGCLTGVSLLLEALDLRHQPHYEVACMGPCIVELSRGDRTARFARDRYTIPDLWLPASATLHNASVEALVQRVVHPGIRGWIGYSKGHSVGVTDPHLFCLHHEALKAEAPAVARTVIVGYISQLVAQIRTLGYGGAVLILPQEPGMDTPESITGTAVLPADKRYRGELWNAGMLNMFEWMLHLRMACIDKIIAPKDVKSLEERARNPPNVAEWIGNIGLPGCSSAQEVQDRDAERVAQLTAIDGALVLNGLLSPIMFGAKFAKVDINAVPEPTRIRVSKRGMRHRSMAATVSTLRESSGIVVSQDGDVSTFANRDGHVCCHQEEEQLGLVTDSACSHVGAPSVPRAHEWILAAIYKKESDRQNGSTP
jgi:hypothetical protein